MTDDVYLLLADIRAFIPSRIAVPNDARFQQLMARVDALLAEGPPCHPCDERLVPPHTKETLDAWAATGRPCGHFATAILSNDLREAVGRADTDHLRALPAIVAYVYNRLPIGCWGSPEAMDRWLSILNEERHRKEQPDHVDTPA